MVKPWETVSLFFAILGFFFFILTAGSSLARRLLSAFRGMRDEQIMVSMPLVVLFVTAFVSEHVGIAAVTGAFLAGVALNKSPLVEPLVLPKIKAISYGFFIPIFFAYSAVLLDMASVVRFLPVIAALVLIVSTGKVIGCGLIARWFGYNEHEQKVIGIGMIPHGEYSIVMAQLALVAGFIRADMYTVVIAFVILSIVITPVLLRWFTRRPGRR